MAGDVQVLAPADQAGAPGSTVDLAFTVQNFQDTEDTFDLEAASNLGWDVSLPDFTAALTRSVAGRFGSRQPSPVEVAACLETLHLEDLAVQVADRENGTETLRRGNRHVGMLPVQLVQPLQ